MGLGVDEKLMMAINREADANSRIYIDADRLKSTAERLHASFPHRAAREIENRLRCVLWSRGLFSTPDARMPTLT
jgi:hypothetical protein